ncbi:MAG: exosortase/archaeosortase family protein [Kiritimatiellales bacterium]
MNRRKNRTKADTDGTLEPALPETRRRNAALITGITALATLLHAVLNRSPAEAYVLWILAAFISATVIRARNPANNLRIDRLTAWTALLCAALIAARFPQVADGWIVWIGIGSLLAWFCGAALAARLSAATLLFTVLVPSIGYFYTLLSFPLSRISTALTVALLRLFGIASTFDNAVIYLGEKQIAVTAACSGIDLLAALLLVGWLLVYFRHDRFWLRLTHYLTLLPIIILCNALRLVIVILAYKTVGEAAFNNTLHSALGIGVVIFSSLLLFAVGSLFPERRS